MAQGGRILAPPCRCCAVQCAPACPRSELDEMAEEFIRSHRGRDARVQGTLRISRAASAPRSTRKSCTAFRRRSACSRKATSCRSTSAWATRATSPTRPPPCPWARSTPRRQRLLDDHRASRSTPASRRRCSAITSATSAPRCRASWKRQASAWCAISWDTASAWSSTKSRRFPTTASRSAARSWCRGSRSRSSRW